MVKALGMGAAIKHAGPVLMPTGFFGMLVDIVNHSCRVQQRCGLSWQARWAPA